MKIGGSLSLKVGSSRAGVVSCSSSLSVSAAKLLRRSTGEGVVRAVGFAVFLGRKIPLPRRWRGHSLGFLVAGGVFFGFRGSAGSV